MVPPIAVFGDIDITFLEGFQGWFYTFFGIFYDGFYTFWKNS